MLSQTKVDPDTNEAKTSLELLKTLVLQGKVMVDDAMFWRREVCGQVTDSGGDYFVVVKQNQPTLKKEIELVFADASGHAPQLLASLRNFVINWLRSQKIVNLAAALRENAWNSERLFTMLGKQIL